jgi:hypothetical protein
VQSETALWALALGRSTVRVVVDASRNRTAGLNDADMIVAISTLYGSPANRSSRTIRVARVYTQRRSQSTPGHAGDSVVFTEAWFAHS